MNATEALNKKIETIRAKREADRTNAENLATSARESLSRAEKEMQTATAAGDLTRYRKAKQEREAASDAVEMHTARLQALDNAPLITKAEYDAEVKAVFDELKSANEAARAELLEISDRATIIGADLRDKIRKANDALEIWQREIYQDENLLLDIGNGKKIPNPSGRLYFRDYRVVDFADTISRGGENLK